MKLFLVVALLCVALVSARRSVDIEETRNDRLRLRNRVRDVDGEHKVKDEFSFDLQLKTFKDNPTFNPNSKDGIFDSKIDYKSESAASKEKWSFRVRGLYLVEYTEGGAEPGFQLGGNDTIVHMWPNSKSQEWGPLSKKAGSLTWNVTSTDGVFTLSMKATESSRAEGPVTLKPDSIKFDYEINFPWTNVEGTKLAFCIKTKSKHKFKARKVESVEGEQSESVSRGQIEFAEGSEPVGPSFSWLDYAEDGDGAKIDVIASSLKPDQGEGDGEPTQFLSLTYDVSGKPAKIIHDPEQGVVTYAQEDSAATSVSLVVSTVVVALASLW